MAVPPQEDVVEGEVIDAEFSEVDEKPKTDPVLDEARAHGLSGLFDDPPQKTQSTMEPPAKPTGEETKPGCIGIKRAKRLYTIISQNHKNTNFTEEELKKIMASWPVPIEHLRDLELTYYPQFEKWATGEEDWREFWKD